MENHTVALQDYNAFITGGSSCLSIFGGILILVTYFTGKPQVKNFTRLLLVYLTIADLLTAVGNLVAAIRYGIVHGVNDNNEHCSESNSTNIQNESRLLGLCKAQSFVTTASNLASFWWTTIIAFHLWSSVVLKTGKTETIFFHIVYHLMSWILPFCIVLHLIVKDYLGEDFCFGTGVWCGIKSDLDHQTIELWMYVADIGWQAACYLVTCLLYMHLKFYLTLRHRGLRLGLVSGSLRNENENFLFIWMVIYLLKLWGMIRFFITTYVSSETLANPHLDRFLSFLLIMQSYGASGQAFWNCLLFCFFDKTVRKSMKGWLCKSGDGDEGRSLLASGQ